MTKKKLGTSMILFSLALVLLWASGNLVYANAALTAFPYNMDSSNQAAWWGPLETYVGGNEYAYMAYNAPGSTSGTHKVYIARRDGDGNWSNIPLLNGVSVAEYSDDIGHSQPSLARDGDGYFHVFASINFRREYSHFCKWRGESASS